VWLGDGTIAVGDAQTRHVRFFTPDGVEVATVGGRGGGPGEFEGIAAVWPLSTDAVAVWDDWLVRTSIVSPAGVIGDPVRIEIAGKRAKPTPLGWAPDGRLIVVSDSRRLEDRDRYRGELEIFTYAADGSSGSPVLTVPGVEMWNWVWENGTTPLPVPFGKSTVLALGDYAIYVGVNEADGDGDDGTRDYQVDRYDLTGQLTLRIRLERDPLPLDEAAIEAYKQAERDKAITGEGGKGPTDIWGRIADDAPYPERLPFYDSILIDDGGRLWVRDYQPDVDSPSRWTIFGGERRASPGGVAQGHVSAVAHLPARFRLTAIRGSSVLGVARDGLDVEYVRVYHLMAR